MPEATGEPRRSFLRKLAIAIGAFTAGAVVGSGNVAAPPGTFDFYRDAPIGLVIHYEGSLSAHPNLPGGATPKWTIIATDRPIVGAATVVESGTEGGTESLTAEVAHAGASVANHLVTQPTAHVVIQPNAHSFTQPSAHANHAVAGAHTHDAHTVVIALGALVGNVVNGPPTHSSDGGHAHDAHSAHAGGAVDPHAGTAVNAHSGTAVDAHAFTEPNTHAIKLWHKSFTLKKTIA